MGKWRRHREEVRDPDVEHVLREILSSGENKRQKLQLFIAEEGKKCDFRCDFKVASSFSLYVPRAK